MCETFDITKNPVHLGLGATVKTLPEFDGTPEWYQRYSESFASDGAEGRLTTVHTFSTPWDMWEMHPVGEELVLCLDGEITLHQELAEGVVQVTLRANEAAVNPAGVWHTADVDEHARCLFITAGVGTDHRPR